MKVCWISAGCSSFLAGYYERDSIDEFIYIDIADQHPDSMRFIKDCEKLLGKEVKVIRSSQYKSVEDCIRTAGVAKMPQGFAPCTNWLKKRVRKEWELEHRGEPITYVWGMDSKEKHRAERLVDTMTQFDHQFPLIERNLDKQAVHAICKKLGLKRPVMYDLGYSNNNCVGCIKGGIGYWNKIRNDFPEVFESRAKLEREIGYSILKVGFLDELDENRGRMNDEILEDCNIFCMLNL